MNRFLIIIALIIFSASGVYAAEPEVVIHGVPLRKAESSVEKTEMKVLDNEDGKGFQMILLREDNKVIWVTRENIELTHTMDGPIHVFLDPKGRGYVKATRTSESQCIYMEHLTRGMATVTYWGVSIKCALP